MATTHLQILSLYLESYLELDCTVMCGRLQALSKVEAEVRRLLPMVKQQTDHPITEHHHEEHTFATPITPRLGPGGPAEAEVTSSKTH